MSDQILLFDDVISDLDGPPIPYWTTTDHTTVRLYLGDVIRTLRRLPSQSVHCIITSPPYWGMRDYRTAEWEGGDPECKHEGKKKEKRTLQSRSFPPHYDDNYRSRTERDGATNAAQFGRYCVKCGATRIDQQIGSEITPEEYVTKMVEVGKEIYRVLRDDGTFWLNIGDSYTTETQNNRNFKGKGSYERIGRKNNNEDFDPKNSGLAKGNLTGVPWMLAFALRSQCGFIIRNDVIWNKPNPMRESVENRCIKSHEYVFLLTKQSDYYFDHIAIREKASSKPHAPGNKKVAPEKTDTGHTTTERQFSPDGFRNKGSVWTIASESYPGLHYATFPTKLITPCILAGTSEKGCCAICGNPWRRVIKRVGGPPNHRIKDGLHKTKKDGHTPKTCHDEGIMSGAGISRLYKEFGDPVIETIGWQPTCTCNGTFRHSYEWVKVLRRKDKGKDKGGEKGRDHSQKSNRHGKDSVSLDDNVEVEWVLERQKVTHYIPRIPLEDHPVVPCVVLDPFVGSGTVCAVSAKLHRRSIGIDLSREYLALNAVPRIEGTLRSIPELAYLAHKQAPLHKEE